MVTVVVRDRYGSPVRHARVHISWGGGIFGTFSSDNTGWDGAVHFNVSSGTGNLMIDGHDYGRHYFDGTTTITV